MYCHTCQSGEGGGGRNPALFAQRPALTSAHLHVNTFFTDIEVTVILFVLIVGLLFMSLM